MRTELWLFNVLALVCVLLPVASDGRRRLLGVVGQPASHGIKDDSGVRVTESDVLNERNEPPHIEDLPRQELMVPGVANDAVESEGVVETKMVGRWYFGGVASAAAACCTHPLDLIKVHLQTQQHGQLGFLSMGLKVLATDGILGLYNGLTASLLRQLTYSTTRFAIYETVKNSLVTPGYDLPFYQKVFLGGLAGCAGGFVGTPADVVNVRMQNDMKIAIEQRRNYKHAIDGLYQVLRQEGALTLMSGAALASARATLMTIGQLSFYDQFKTILLKTAYFQDNMWTHFLASLLAGGVVTLMTMPLDVMKTRMMSATPGHYKTLMACALDIAREGPLGFFKGFVPAFVRLGPQTILTFIFLEQLRLNFGVTVLV